MISSGEVSRRTNTTFSPFAAQAFASSAVNTILPHAAPGDAGNAFPIGLAAFNAFASKVYEEAAKNQKKEESTENTKEDRTKKRLELEQIKSDLQDEFIHQNTARLNIITAREKMEESIDIDLVSYVKDLLEVTQG